MVGGDRRRPASLRAAYKVEETRRNSEARALTAHGGLGPISQLAEPIYRHVRYSRRAGREPVPKAYCRAFLVPEHGRNGIGRVDEALGLELGDSPSPSRVNRMDKRTERSERSPIVPPV